MAIDKPGREASEKGPAHTLASAFQPPEQAEFLLCQPRLGYSVVANPAALGLILEHLILPHQ